MENKKQTTTKQKQNKKAVRSSIVFTHFSLITHARLLFVIGYPSGQDGAILPARDHPLFSARIWDCSLCHIINLF